MKFVGIDISMAAPSFTIYDSNDGEFSFKTCKKYFLTDSKKNSNDILDLNIFCDSIPEYNSPEERWDKISNWGIEQIKSCDYALIEGYAYASSSQAAFQIAEHASIWKYKIYKLDIPFKIEAPSKIKKFATSKGNANKELMYDSFTAETGIKLRDYFNLTEKQWEPMAGVIDSYYMCKMCYEENRDE